MPRGRSGARRRFAAPRRHDASGPGRHGAPRITVTGFAFWGGVGVERKRRKQRKQSD